MKSTTNWLRSAFVLIALGACQSQPSEKFDKPLLAPSTTTLPADKSPIPRTDGLSWPMGYVDTLQPKKPESLRLTPSSRTAFMRLPTIIPDTSETHCLQVAGPSVQRKGKVPTLPLCQGTQKLLTYDQTENPDSSILGSLHQMHT